MLGGDETPKCDDAADRNSWRVHDSEPAISNCNGMEGRKYIKWDACSSMAVVPFQILIRKLTKFEGTGHIDIRAMKPTIG